MLCLEVGGKKRYYLSRRRRDIDFFEPIMDSTYACDDCVHSLAWKCFKLNIFFSITLLV